MKKRISLMLATIMILCVMVVPVSADYVNTEAGQVYLREGEKISGYLKYVVENNEASIVGAPEEFSKDTLVIPDEIDGMPVTSVSFDMISGAYENDTAAPKINITIGKNVKNIPRLVVSGYDVTYSVQAENAYLAAYDGGLYSKDKTVLYGYPGAKKGTIIVPDGVKKIGDWALAFIRDEVKIILPEGLTHIGYGAFSQSQITDINLPGSLVEIEGDAFNMCGIGLKKLIIPNGVTVLNEYVFGVCQFEALYLPKSIALIKDNALLANIENIYYEGSEAEWNAIERTEYGITVNDPVMHFNAKAENTQSANVDVFQINDGDSEVTVDLKLSLNAVFAEMNAVMAGNGIDVANVMDNYNTIINIYYNLYEEGATEYAGAVLPVIKEARNVFQKNADGLIDALDNAHENGEIQEGIGYLFEICEQITALECLMNGKGRPMEEETEKEPSYDYFDFDAAPVAFQDVPASEWYAETVKKASASGIIKGKGNGMFEPGSNLTIAEAMTLAAKVNAVYYDRMDILNSYTEQFSGDGIHWAFGIAQYCADFGLIYPWACEFDEECSRYMMAAFFFHALPEENLTAMNDISKAPEQLTPDEYQIEILFAAGIMIGDQAGFRLDSSVTRAEAAALIYRVANPEARIKLA